jgi:hypothetical protein
LAHAGGLNLYLLPIPAAAIPGISHQTVAHRVQAGQPRLAHTFAADRESSFMKAGYGKTVRPVCWNSYAPICRYVAQIEVEVAVNVVADLYSIGHEASFSKLQASKSQALGASSGVDCRRGPGAWVLALGVLAKLDATIQLFHTSH